MTDKTMDSPLAAIARRGWLVAAALAVLTVVEYAIAIGVDSLIIIWLLPFALAKGWLILDYFMHFRAFLRGGDH